MNQQSKVSQHEKDKANWAVWLKTYGVEKFYESFMNIAQGAKGFCTSCGQDIYLDIREGGGVPDWRTKEGDYGCDLSTEYSDEYAGSHRPIKLDEVSND